MTAESDTLSKKQTESEHARLKKKQKDVTRYADELKNPCLKESEQSLKCMSDNGYDRDKCALYFKNYKNCQDFWTQVQRDRRRQGLKPYLPLPEERPGIKQEFFQKMA